MHVNYFKYVYLYMYVLRLHMLYIYSYSLQERGIFSVVSGHDFLTPS